MSIRALILTILAVQILTFVALGIIYLAQGEWRLGTAQILLAAVQGIIYTGSMA